MSATRLLSVLLSLVLLAGVLPAPVASQTATTPPTSADADVAAGFANVFYVPGKAITCVGAAAIWVVIMAATFGYNYDDATHFAAGGCGGKWTVHGRDVQPAIQSANP